MITPVPLAHLLNLFGKQFTMDALNCGSCVIKKR